VRSTPRSISTPSATSREHRDRLRRRSRSGPLGKLSKRERFDWLVAPRNTIIQPSPVHTGRCTDLAKTLDHLLDAMVRAPRR
jgi:Protein of unknown function (DUF3037).